MDQIELIEAFLKLERIPYSIVTDPSILMKISKGKLNPKFCKAVKVNYSEDVYFFNIYEAVKWVEEFGMRLLCRV